MAETNELEPKIEEPSDVSEVVPDAEAETETAKKVEKQLEKIRAKIEGISKIAEVPSSRMSSSDPCILAYEAGGPRRSVCWFYILKRKPGYRMILAEKVEGRVGKRTLYITATGIESKDGTKFTISKVVQSIKEYIKARGWV